MAQQSSSGRGGTATATKNRPKGSAQISEAEIGQYTVDEIRKQLKRRGISGTSALRKPELVKTLVKTLRAEQRGGAAAPRKSAGPARKSTAPAKKTVAARSGATRGATARGATARGGGARGGGARGGASRASKGGPSRSLKYAQKIASLSDRPERLGRSLVTRTREVIQRWARDRNAKPATIAGTEKGDRPGVLTFNFPGWREGGRLRQITWDQWFKSFDGRRLNFIYQEQRTDGRQSNFFRVENPTREDA